MREFLRVALCVGSSAVLASCADEGPVVPAPPSAECRAGGEAARVSGRWMLEISGAYEQCDEDRRNRDFEIRPHLELEVSQRTESETPGVESLGLARPVEGIRFAGSVDGECVRFELAEEKAGGAAMAFAGVAGEGEISGDFQGNGPAGCVSSGSFAARFRHSASR